MSVLAKINGQNELLPAATVKEEGEERETGRNNEKAGLTNHLHLVKSKTAPTTGTSPLIQLITSTCGGWWAASPIGQPSWLKPSSAAGLEGGWKASRPRR